MRKGFSRRRGRPMSSRPSIDYGTPELAAKRTRSQTSEILDILHNKGLLNESELWCALHFRRLYSLLYGTPHVQAADPSRHRSYAAHTAVDEDWRIKRSCEYMEAAQLLNDHNALKPILQIAVFNEPAYSVCRDLRRGLKILQDLWQPR